MEERVRASFPATDVTVETHGTGFGVGAPVFEEESEFVWEVDDVREIMKEEVLPRLSPGEDVRIEVRVSEPPEVREALAAELRGELAQRGIGVEGGSVRVLSAYKQGCSWIVDHLLPRLKEAAVERIEIDYHHLLESEEVRWNVVGSDTRWLQELFPVDAVLARELGIPDSAVVFRATGSTERTYRLRAMDSSGTVVLDEGFSPRYVIRPYFDLHPDYERVRVTTGWITAEAGGRTIVDRRVRTDLERFWDFWQGEILPRLRDYLMDLQEGDPSPVNALPEAARASTRRGGGAGGAGAAVAPT